MITISSETKLFELCQKAVAVEEEIIQQEKRYHDAVIKGCTASFIVSIRETIKLLYRKEILFYQVIENRLKYLLADTGFYP
ncbi:hypothetical protein [Segetibacter sp.]|jgi:hypothetical protein|uniref:hypothetical protein n=1 Tax=Segetibacter sp. TaxID=2231182 RepID=UPI00260C4254|nr:hypothetical protein [Segetibacter sp.]MCW3080332.1 hypothetical protein [Segetibacter sp.]